MHAYRISALVDIRVLFLDAQDAGGLRLLGQDRSQDTRRLDEIDSRFQVWRSVTWLISCPARQRHLAEKALDGPISPPSQIEIGVIRHCRRPAHSWQVANKSCRAGFPPADVVSYYTLITGGPNNVIVRRGRWGIKPWQGSLGAPHLALLPYGTWPSWRPQRMSWQ